MKWVISSTYISKRKITHGMGIKCNLHIIEKDHAKECVISPTCISKMDNQTYTVHNLGYSKYRER